MPESYDGVNSIDGWHKGYIALAGWNSVLSVGQKTTWFLVFRKLVYLFVEQTLLSQTPQSFRGIYLCCRYEIASCVAFCFDFHYIVAVKSVWSFLLVLFTSSIYCHFHVIQ